jgi:TolB-like protein/class 3 adenylate cyclase
LLRISSILQFEAVKSHRGSLPMEQEQPGRIGRRLAAIVAADVAGYSRLMGLDEVGTARSLREHRAVIDTLVTKHGGRLVKTTGDGVLLEFPSVVDAVECAVAVQAVMAERNAGVAADRRMLFRIGINLGDILIEGDDILGDGVNIAARLEGIAEPGGICISSSAYEQVRGKVPVEFTDIGERTLKNIARPIRAYAFVNDGVDAKTRGESTTPKGIPPPLADKPSIAVLPFQNMSGDPEQEYFADGLAEDIITELSRFREFAVIARNSTFFYKGKPLDLSQVSRDLNVRYVLEGSVRKVGRRVRVAVQLIEAVTNDHLWAERYDWEEADVFALQEKITRTVVASIAPQIELAEIARSRRDTTSLHAWQLSRRAAGLYNEAYSGGDAELMQQAIAACEEAISADATLLAAHVTLFWARWLSYLYRWGECPDEEVNKAWAVVERMTAINSQDERTLTARGWVRVTRGEYSGGLADLRRAHEVNPNYAFGLIALAFAEATTGLGQEAEAHAQLALRLSPRDYGPGGIGLARLVLAMAHFTLRNYDEAARWCEAAIQAQHRAPIRRALMIACSARAGDMARARAETAVLNSFAPDFIASVFRGQNPVFTRKEDMESLLDGLRLAGLSN